MHIVFGNFLDHFSERILGVSRDHRSRAANEWARGPVLFHKRTPCHIYTCADKLLPMLLLVLLAQFEDKVVHVFSKTEEPSMTCALMRLRQKLHTHLLLSSCRHLHRTIVTNQLEVPHGKMTLQMLLLINHGHAGDLVLGHEHESLDGVGLGGHGHDVITEELLAISHDFVLKESSHWLMCQIHSLANKRVRHLLGTEESQVGVKITADLGLRDKIEHFAIRRCARCKRSSE